jgi:aspartyl-tRNA(Asn)/glutamyl-tRNA(Gln) amidotransferase subunit C
MTRVTVETVDHVARLARLRLSDEERKTYARQLDEILAYAESIQTLDTSNVEPMSHSALRPSFREDVARPGLPRPAALTGAPDATEGLFRVPRILPG